MSSFPDLTSLRDTWVYSLFDPEQVRTSQDDLKQAHAQFLLEFCKMRRSLKSDWVYVTAVWLREHVQGGKSKEDCMEHFKRCAHQLTYDPKVINERNQFFQRWSNANTLGTAYLVAPVINTLHLLKRGNTITHEDIEIVSWEVNPQALNQLKARYQYPGDVGMLVLSERSFRVVATKLGNPRGIAFCLSIDHDDIIVCSQNALHGAYHEFFHTLDLQHKREGTGLVLTEMIAFIGHDQMINGPGHVSRSMQEIQQSIAGYFDANQMTIPKRQFEQVTLQLAQALVELNTMYSVDELQFVMLNSKNLTEFGYFYVLSGFWGKLW